jgi:hypothetical protein
MRSPRSSAEMRENLELRRITPRVDAEHWPSDTVGK